MDSTININNPDILKKLKYSETIPKGKHDFHKFVNNLLEEPTSSSVIDEVWSRIYGSESVLCNEQEQDLPRASNTDVNSEHNGGNSNNECLSDVSNSSSTKTENIQNHKKCNESDSSDCEIVEVLPVNKSSCDNSLDNVSDHKTYDSDSSVEVLEHSFNSNYDKERDSTSCNFHNGNIHMSSYVNYKDLLFKTENSSNQFSHIQFKLYEESIASIVHNFNERHKEIEREQLRTEVKTLKSLLIGLITHVSNKKLSIITNISSNEPSTGDTVHSPSPKAIKESAESDQLMVYTKKNPINCSSTFNSKISNLSNIEQVELSNICKKSKKTAKHCVKPQNADGFDHKTNRSESEITIEDKKQRKRFPWRDAIVEVLKSRTSKQLPVEKLKKKVIAKYYCYRGNISTNTPAKFYRYLQSTSRVVIHKERAKYIADDDVPKTRQKKNEIITKTVTTTRKFVVS